MGVIFLLLLLLHSPQTSQKVIDYLPYLLVFRVQVTPPQKRLRRRVSALADTVESLMVRLDRLVRLDDYQDPDAVRITLLDFHC